MAEERGNGLGSTFTAFLLGAAIGGGLALLFAPRSGAETREKMRKMADDVRTRTRDIYAQAESRLRQTMEEGRAAYEEKRSSLKAAAEAGREAYRGSREAGTTAEAGPEEYRPEHSEPT